MKRFIKWLSLTLVSLFVSVGVLLFFWPSPALLSGISFSQAVYDDHEHLLRLALSQDDKYRLFTPLSEISPQLVTATLLQEDQYFHWHNGINPFAVFKAAWQTYILKSRRVGASTISMQVARLRYHINSKNVLGKVKQIVRALQIEMHYSKDQILEAYLNLAPYGNNIEGVGAASLIYFDKPVGQLALPEALALSVIPQNPTDRAPHQHKLKEIRAKLYQRWVALHPEDRDKKILLDLPLQMQNRQSLPFLAPHFVTHILRNGESQHQIVTTLDLHLQKIIEHGVQQYLLRKKSLGVHNAAVILVDTRDMSVKALVGSANFFDRSIQGQINGTQAKRSPGSTLKPFIYGLALDQGLIHPNTVLKDVPHSFGTYNPENFDYDFMGPIKAKDALALSRNIPAIYLASQLANPTLYQLLEKAQISHLKAESHYGLALVLGGAEVTMQELAQLYAMLVNEGVWHSLRMRKDQPVVEGKRLLSPEASFLVLDMLEKQNEHRIPVALKTGTSSGFRDAWSMGAFGPYVLGVWIGNFNNQGNHSFVGKTMAAPLFSELIAAIQSEAGSLPKLEKHPEKLHLTHIPVCKASGMLPTRYCLDTELTWFIPGKSPIKSDTIFREIPIDKNTGLRTCQFDENARFEIFEFWPSDLLKIFKEAGFQRRTPPPFNPDCRFTKSTGMNPQITSPRLQLSYVMRGGPSDDTQIPLTAIAEGDVSTLYWFVNETFLTKTARDQIYLWKAKPGKFVIRVVDDHGRSDARDLTVLMDS